MDDIEVILRASVADLQAGMQTAADTVSASTREMGANLDALAESSTAASEKITEGMGLVKGAFGALLAYEGFSAVIDAAKESERAFALVESQIRATGGAAGFTAEQMRSYADSLQQTTTFSHSEVEDLEARLMAFTNITGAQFTRAIQVMLDFSSVTGRDAATAVRTLGVALDDPEKGMTRLRQAGIVLSDWQKEEITALEDQGDLMGAQNKLLDALQASYGGAAAAMRDTFGGALTGLKNQLMEDVEGGPGSFNGAKQAVNELEETLKDPGTIAAIQALITVFASLVGVLAKVVEGYGDLIAGFERLQSDARANGIEQMTKQLEAMAAAGEQGTQAYKDLEDQLIKTNNAQLGAGGVPGAPSTGTAVAPTAAAGTQPMQFAPSLPDLTDSSAVKPIPAETLASWQAADNSFNQFQLQTKKADQDQTAAFTNWAQGWDNANKMAQETKQAWLTALSPIGSAFSTSIDAVIRGTTSWKQAMGNMIDSVLQSYLNLGVQTLINHIATEEAKTSATTTAESARAASRAAAAAADRAVTTTTSVADIGSYAAAAAAAAAASVAAIPFVGWVMAPGVAAETYASTLAYAAVASAAGGWAQVPNDQLAMIHKNEMVLPASIAGPVREAASGGGMGGGMTVHIHAMDGPSLRDFIRRNPSAFADGLTAAHRRGARVKQHY